MFSKKTLFFGFLSTLFLIGCSDSSPTDPDREDLSSSSQIESSSSVKVSSSSIDSSIPEGARRATISDLSKNMSLGTLLGADVYMVAGEKGLFSFWFFKEGGTTEAESHGWIVVNSDFENGIIQIESSTAVPAYDTSSVGDKIVDLVKKSAKISFIVKKDSSVYYSIDDGDYVKASSVQLIASTGYVSKASTLENNQISCKISADTSFSIEFFSDGRYVRKNTNGSALTWSAGFYDIHRSNLFLSTSYFYGSALTLYNYKVNSSSLSLDSYTCTKKTFEKTIWDKEAIAKAWIAQDTLNWTFVIDKSGSFTLKADRQAEDQENKTGSWDQFGSYLALNVETCLNPKTCSSATIGEVADLTETSFSYNHLDESTPTIPSTWNLAEIDE